MTRVTGVFAIYVAITTSRVPVAGTSTISWPDRPARS
jgi:hypothetical protein